MAQVDHKTCDDEFTLPNGRKVSGCPWNRYVRLHVCSCQKICDESFFQLYTMKYFSLLLKRNGTCVNNR